MTGIGMSLSPSFSRSVRYGRKATRDSACIPAGSVDQKSSCKSRRAGRDELPSSRDADRQTYTYSHTNVRSSPKYTFPPSPRILSSSCFTFSFSSSRASLCERHPFHVALALLDVLREEAALGIHLIDRFTAPEDIPSPHYPWHVFSPRWPTRGPVSSEVNMSSVLEIDRLTARAA